MILVKILHAKMVQNVSAMLKMRMSIVAVLRDMKEKLAKAKVRHAREKYCMFFPMQHMTRDISWVHKLKLCNSFAC